jgi:hypothetical protein
MVMITNGMPDRSVKDQFGFRAEMMDSKIEITQMDAAAMADRRKHFHEK